MVVEVVDDVVELELLVVMDVVGDTMDVDGDGEYTLLFDAQDQVPVDFMLEPVMSAPEKFPPQ